MDHLPDLLESQLKDCHHILEITKKLIENISILDHQQIELFLNQRGSRIEALGNRFRSLEKFLGDKRSDNEMDKWVKKIRDKIEEILTVDKDLRKKVRDRSLYILEELRKLRDGKRAVKSYHGVEIIPKFLDKKI